MSTKCEKCGAIGCGGICTPFDRVVNECVRLTSERDALKDTCERQHSDFCALSAVLGKVTSERDAALAEVAALQLRLSDLEDIDVVCDAYIEGANRDLARIDALESALSEALAALQLAREALAGQHYLLYMNRKTCRCWGKMTGSCPNCAKSVKIEKQGSEAVSLADTALRKGEGRDG